MLTVRVWTSRHYTRNKFSSFNYHTSYMRVRTYSIYAKSHVHRRRAFVSSIKKFKSLFLIRFDKTILKSWIYRQLRLINRRECVYETNAHIKKKKNVSRGIAPVSFLAVNTSWYTTGKGKKRVMNGVNCSPIDCEINYFSQRIRRVNHKYNKWHTFFFRNRTIFIFVKILFDTIA